MARRPQSPDPGGDNPDETGGEETVLDGPGNRRATAMDEIVASRRSDIAEESGVAVEDVTGAEEDPGDTGDTGAGGQLGAAPAETPLEPPEEEPAADAAADGEAPDGATEPPAERMVTIKVDGVERQVPESEIVAAYQKNTAADARLEEANRLLREAREAAQTPRSPGAADGAGDPDSSPAPDPNTTGEDADPLAGVDLAGIAEKLQFAEGEEVTAALRQFATELVGARGQNQPALSPQQIADAVVQDVRNRQAYDDFVSEYARFGEENEDIVSDPDLTQFLGMKFRQVAEDAYRAHESDGTPMPSQRALLDTAGGLVREKVGLQKAEPKPKEDGDDSVVLSDERTTRKRQARPPVTTATAPSTTGTTPAPSQSADSQIETSRRSGIDAIIASRKKDPAEVA